MQWKWCRARARRRISSLNVVCTTTIIEDFVVAIANSEIFRCSVDLVVDYVTQFVEFTVGITNSWILQ